MGNVESEKLMRNLPVFLVSLGLTFAAGAVALGATFNVHIAGDPIYPPSLPNDFEIYVAVTEPAVVGNPTNSSNAQWGSISSTTHSGASFFVRWVGPPLPGLVGQPRHFAFDFMSDQPSISVTEAWWTINGQQIERIPGDSFTIEGVPEPVSLSLLAIGGLGLLLRRRR